MENIIPTGFKKLDEKIGGGLQTPSLTIIAGGSMAGQRSFIFRILEYVAVITNTPSAIFLMSMGKEEAVQGMMSSYARVDVHKVMTGFLPQADWPRLVSAAEKLSEAPIYYIRDKNNLNNLAKLDTELEMLKTICQIKLLIIDDIEQLISATQGDDVLVYCHLQKLMKKFNMSILIVNQFKKALSRPKPYILLSELKESEQRADLIIFMTQNESDKQDKSIITMKIAKNRTGPVGTIKINVT